MNSIVILALCCAVALARPGQNNWETTTTTTGAPFMRMETSTGGDNWETSTSGDNWESSTGGDNWETSTDDYNWETSSDSTDYYDNWYDYWYGTGNWDTTDGPLMG